METSNIIKDKVIDCLIVSVVDTFLQMVNIPLNLKDQYYKNEIEANESILVLFGVSGQMKGQIGIEISDDLSMKIATNIMQGMPNIIFDDNVKNSINELFSVIVGTVASKLLEYDVVIDFTPPTIIKGKELVLYFVNNKIFSVPLTGKNGKVELYVDLE